MNCPPTSTGSGTPPTAGWTPDLTATAAADRNHRTAAQAERSRRAAEERAGDAAAAEAGAAGLRARLEAVEATVGEDYRQIVARVTEARDELRRCREAAARAADLLLRLEGRIGGLRATSGQDAERREQAVLVRDRAAQRFRHLCLVGLAEDAGIAPEPDAGDGAKATLEAARAVAANWPGIPHAPRNLGDAATRLSEAVHEARRRLGARADLDLEPDDDVQLLTATLDGVRVGAHGPARPRSPRNATAAGTTSPTASAPLRPDPHRRHPPPPRRSASARPANSSTAMNGRLERVRTASHVAVQLVWQVDARICPAGTRTARELLLKDPGRITEADREALHAFFRARIEEAKASDTAASWEEQLGEVLDYTAWHRFVVRLDRANGTGWQPLTKKLHGALSGGEKAIALHLPLFAAVAAHYEAVPEAPRLILLDEVFVGVDTANRGQVFALLTALDLDLVLTSDHEWCTYRRAARHRRPPTAHRRARRRRRHQRPLRLERHRPGGGRTPREPAPGERTLGRPELARSGTRYTTASPPAAPSPGSASARSTTPSARPSPTCSAWTGCPTPAPPSPWPAWRRPSPNCGGRTVRETVTAIVGPLDDRAARTTPPGSRTGRAVGLAGRSRRRCGPSPRSPTGPRSCRAAGLVGGSPERTRSLLPTH